MAASKKLAEQQRQVVTGMLVGIVSTVILFFLIRLIPFKLPDDDVVDRISYALQWNILPTLMLFLGIIITSRRRFFSGAIDPLAGKDPHDVKVDAHYVDNTLQSLVLFVMMSLGFASLVGAQHLWIIADLSIIFVIARIVFWLGYLQKSTHRAAGMFMTELVTYLPLLYVAYRVIMNIF